MFEHDVDRQGDQGGLSNDAQGSIEHVHAEIFVGLEAGIFGHNFLGNGLPKAPGFHGAVKFFQHFPVSFGGQEWPDDPDQPIIVHMERFPHRDRQGLSAREQRKLGRYELLATPFETMERETRAQLASLLSGADFDPARDIAGITVNRWAHGYADGYWDFGDPWLGGNNDERKPHVRGRKPFGRITIANSDAGGSAMLESAVLQAHRAVEELKAG